MIIAVRFNEIVTVSNTGDVYIPFTISDTTYNATYLSGSGTDVLMFKFTVPEDKVLNGITLGDISGKANIKDLKNNVFASDLIKSFPEVIIDSRVSGISSITSSSNQKMKSGDSLNIYSRQ